ncbi:hypothetical protein GCK72_015978 [Caenorhabditis remanei]|uniref:Uncharacterized protein n=1 Tax=Caenorhabditis remanei TaxID=31234 RepID=A0A6A5GXV1_CAERE|nr:hypothetical protein GCK72_015978 [Caenorhabditis remanei]KAF1759511.1 hypothetical protein GCK72_015978 [Caenorhabditis remanei]
MSSASSPWSSAYSFPWTSSSEYTEIREIDQKIDWKTEKTLKQQLEKAQLENSIRKQKMEILGLEIAEISKNFEKSLKGIEWRRLTFEQLSAGNRLAMRMLKEQLKEIETLRGGIQKNQKNQKTSENQKTCEAAEHIMKYVMEQRKMQPSAK